MGFFTENKEVRVQGFVLKLVNNNCPELRALMEGPRIDSRVNLLVVVMVVPLENDQIQKGQTLMAVTKEFSNSGVAVVLERPRGFDQVVLGFRVDGEMTFVKAQAKHLSPMGGGFHQLGLQMLEVVHPTDYPGLETMSF